MYTQCPDCTTVFRVTTDALRSAQGNVRCGVCATSFNALENLSEEPFRAGPGAEGTPAPEDTITVEELPGNENIELSTPAEAGLASEAAMKDGLEDAAPDGDPSFEFDGDIGDLDRLFIEVPATELRHMAAAARAAEAPRSLKIDPGVIAASLSKSRDDDAKMVPGSDGQLHSALDPTDEFPIIVLDESDEVLESPAAFAELLEESQAEPGPEPRQFLPNPFEAPRILIPDEMRKGLAEEAAASAISGADFDEPAADDDQRRWPWALGTAILMLMLGAQVVHVQRNALVQKPAIGPLLAQAYALLGFPIAVPTDLASYELRQWGAASDAMHPGRLLLRASIVNRASHAQPYPLLRLALQDRFGTTVGARDVEPADYLPGEGAGKLLGPGQRADAEIRIVDPGKDAVGFEMDVCLPMTGGVHCANEGQPAAQ